MSEEIIQQEKKYLGEFLSFIKAAFSESGTPSSSRLIGGVLSLWSMGLIAWMVKHMMWQPLDKLQVWIGGLPLIIGALATFAVSPYGVAKITGIWNKPKNDVPDDPKS